MVELPITPLIIQIGVMTLILLIFAYIMLKYLTYTKPNPDAKISLSDKDPNHTLKGYKRQDLSIHELRKYDGRHVETNFVIFVAVNGYIFDVTIDRSLYGPGGHYFVLAGRDASRALSKFTISCESIPTEEDLMSDLTSSEVDQLNEWYAQFSERYQCVGRLIRSTQERYTYDHSDEETLDDSDDNFDDDLEKYCGIQSEVMNIPLNTAINDTTDIKIGGNKSINMTKKSTLHTSNCLLDYDNKLHLTPLNNAIDSDKISSCSDNDADIYSSKHGNEETTNCNPISSPIHNNNDILEE